MQDEEKKEDSPQVLRSCCFVCDKTAALFTAQLLLSVFVMVFAMSQLVVDKSDANFNRWSPMLSLILGIFLPAPRPH